MGGVAIVFYLATIEIPIWITQGLLFVFLGAAMLPWHLNTCDVEEKRCYWIAEAVSGEEYASWLKQKQLEMLMEEGRCDVIGDVTGCRIKSFDFDWIASKLSIS